MISKTLTYEDYNGNPHTETLYFHISKPEIADNMDLEDEFREVSVFFEGGKRELKRDEVKRILELIKRLIKLGYGVRSEDGQHFRKSEERWNDFHDSAAYDALIWSMFEEPEKAVEFMTGIIPSDLVAKAKEQMEAEQRKVPQDRLPKQVAAKADAVKEVPFEEPAVAVAESDEVAELEARLAAARAAQAQV